MTNDVTTTRTSHTVRTSGRRRWIEIVVVYVILLEMTAAAAAQSARDVTVNETRTDVWTDGCS